MKLRLLKYLTSILLMTLVAVVYVHQQVELVKLSYAIEYKEKELESMLDRKADLQYNIDNLEAPSRLEKTLVSRKVDIAFPKKGQVVRVAKIQPDLKGQPLRAVGIEKKVNRFWIFEFFGVGAEAQAKER